MNSFSNGFAAARLMISSKMRLRQMTTAETRPVPGTVNETAAVNQGKAGFAQDFAKLAGGTASSQLIGVLAAPFIARVFSPADFGTLAVFAAVAGTVSVIASLRYELAIFVPKSDEEASHVFWLCLALVFATSILTSIFMLLAGNLLWARLNSPGLQAIWYVVPISIFFTGWFSVLQAWNMRLRSFGRLSALEVVSRLATVGSQIVVGLIGAASAETLILTTVFGAFAETSILAWRTWHQSSRLLKAGLRWQAIWCAAKRYARFPKYTAGSTILNNSSGHLPAVLISAFFSVATAGQYSLGYRLIRVPGRLIGANITAAFFPRAAQARSQGTLARAVELTWEYLIKVSVFPCVLLATVGKDLFLVVFGRQWAEAGVFCQLLSAWLLGWFISSPLTNTVLMVLEEQAIELRFQAIIFASRAGSLLLGGFAGSPMLAVGLFSVTGMIVYAAYSVVIFQKSHARPWHVLRPLLLNVLYSVPAVLSLIAIKHYTDSSLIVVIASAVLLIGYFCNFFRVDPIARELASRFGRRTTVAAA